MSACFWSLQCVKKHKEDSGCSGIRNKTAFVPVSQFDEMALLSGESLSYDTVFSRNQQRDTSVRPCVCLDRTWTSDYRFLEDTGRFADGATRDKLIRTPRSTGKVSPALTVWNVFSFMRLDFVSQLQNWVCLFGANPQILVFDETRLCPHLATLVPVNMHQWWTYWLILLLSCVVEYR